MPTNATRNSRIVELRLQGWGPRAIARQLGISPNVVAGVLKRAAMTDENHLHSHKVPRERVPREKRQEVAEASCGMSLRRAEEELGWSNKAIMKWRREFGVPAGKA